MKKVLSFYVLIITFKKNKGLFSLFWRILIKTKVNGLTVIVIRHQRFKGA
jgi:hypothetical protein